MSAFGYSRSFSGRAATSVTGAKAVFKGSLSALPAGSDHSQHVPKGSILTQSGHLGSAVLASITDSMKDIGRRTNES
jgi:hypothetical protein